MIRFAAALFLTLFATFSVQAETVFTVGVVPQFEPRKLALIWLPILSELEQRTGLKFKLQGAKDIPEFEHAFSQGEYDLAYMNPYHAIVANGREGYLPLVRDGGRSLFGILVVRKDSDYISVSELDGATIAYPSPNALGASLLMRADLELLEGIKTKPKYVKTHSSVYLNVVLGQVPAGGGVMGTLKQQPQQVQDSLKIVYKTRAIPPHPLTAHPRMAEADRDKIQNALMEMATSEDGARLLSKVPFVQPIPTSMVEYQPLSTWGLDAFYVTSE